MAQKPPLLLSLALAFLMILVNSQGIPHTRSYFYIGGAYLQSGDGNIVHGQIYVEHLVPLAVTRPFPLMFIHGNGMTGTNFLNTPDGRRGWADHFMSKGYEVYLIDQPARARSPWQANVDGSQSIFDTSYIESHFTATERYNLWPQATLHTQWPGNGSFGDEVFDAFYKSIMPSLTSDVETSQLIRNAGAQLLDKIGPVVLATHSQSGPFGWILADARPLLVKSIVALEPSGPPFQNAIFASKFAFPYGLTAVPVSFSPPIDSPTDLHRVAVSVAENYTCWKQGSPVRKLTNLVDIPVVLVTSESGYHAVYDDCTVNFLKDAGVPVEPIRLEEEGIRGNGHMMFMEKNSLDIADVITDWLMAKAM